MESLTSYQNDFPYDKRIGKASITFHKNETSYNMAYKLKSVIPSYTLFYLSKIFGSKKFKENISELK